MAGRAETLPRRIAPFAVARVVLTAFVVAAAALSQALHLLMGVGLGF